MHRLVALAAGALVGCASSAVGGAAGAGGSGGDAGPGVSGGSGGSGGTGGSACVAPTDLPVLYLELPAGARNLDRPGIVVEHRDLSPGEIPDGAGPVNRLLLVEGGAVQEQTRLLYRVAGAELWPPVRPGDRVTLGFRLYAPAGASWGATLRTPEGRLLWAAERGDFGGLGTGEPDLRIEPGAELCAWDDCGTYRRRQVAVSLDGGAAVEVAPGEVVALDAGDRAGSVHLAEWADSDRVTCTETPSSLTGFVLAAPPQGPCGGACPPGYFCDFPRDDCGATGPGVCARAPDDCPVAWACGCDGSLYRSECDAWTLGVDVDARGTCEAPEDAFRCGHLFCASFTEVCWVLPGGQGSRFECRSAPAACAGAASCACVDLPADLLCSCGEAGPDVTVRCDL